MLAFQIDAPMIASQEFLRTIFSIRNLMRPMSAGRFAPIPALGPLPFVAPE